MKLADQIACQELRAREKLLLQDVRHGAKEALRSFLRDLGCHDAAAEVPDEIEHQSYHPEEFI